MERPILFSGPMVNAIMGGRKTQTRRIVRWPDWIAERDRMECAIDLSAGKQIGQFKDGRAVRRMRRYADVGDRLWVRETFAYMGNEDGHLVRRDGSLTDEMREAGIIYAADPNAIRPEIGRAGWRPSIYMRREHSRMTLAVEDIRCERLHDISEADARAEGFPINHKGEHYEPPPPSVDPWQGYARASFCLAWDRINGKRAAWDSNPWVWVVTFSVVPA